MASVIKIDGETISQEQFINYLKLRNEYPDLISPLVRDKVAVNAAIKRGIQVSDKEIQQAADDYRRLAGLHRAKDTEQWLDQAGISLEDFEAFISDQTYKKKLRDTIITDETIDEYFKLNSPKFDTVDLQLIVVASEAKAKELMAVLKDDPQSFSELAKEHSLDPDTKDLGGQIRGVRRGILPEEVDAKIFNAKVGDLIGPIQTADEDIFELARITAVAPARINDMVKEEIARTIYDEWIASRLQEHSVEL